MPSLMALKKALPGRQPESFRESFISVECFLIFKKIKRGTQNFSKRKVKVRKTSTVEVESSLNFVHAHGNFVNLDYRNFSTKIIIPL